MSESGATDQTPSRIVVWACPKCGYWRDEHSTGVHQVFSNHGPAVLHPLVECVYIFEGMTGGVGS